MEISSEMKEKLITEYRFIAEKMRNAEDTTLKMYLFSGAYGMTYRVFNFEYDSELIFIHHLLQSAFGAINNRVTVIRSGDRTILLDDDFFRDLTSILDDLANTIENDLSIYEILLKLSGLIYYTTGNGHYLTLKGINLF